MTGGTTDSDVLAKEIAEWAKPMIGSSIASYTKRVDMIVTDSNVGMKGRKTRGAAGLSSDQRAELQQIDAICTKVPEGIDALNKSFARPLIVDAMKNKVDAANLSTRIQAILKADNAIVRNRK